MDADRWLFGTAKDGGAYGRVSKPGDQPVDRGSNEQTGLPKSNPLGLKRAQGLDRLPYVERALNHNSSCEYVVSLSRLKIRKTLVQYSAAQ